MAATVGDRCAEIGFQEEERYSSTARDGWRVRRRGRCRSRSRARAGGTRAPRPVRRRRRRCARRACVLHDRREERGAGVGFVARVPNRGDERSRDRQSSVRAAGVAVRGTRPRKEVAQSTPTPSSSRATATRDAPSRGRAQPRPRETPSQHSDGVTSLRTSMSRTSSGQHRRERAVRVSVDAQPRHDVRGGPPFPVGDVGQHRSHERHIERAGHAGVVDRAGNRGRLLVHARSLPVDRAVEADHAAIAEMDQRGAQDRQARLIEQPADAAGHAPGLRQLAAQLVVEHLDAAADRVAWRGTRRCRRWRAAGRSTTGSSPDAPALPMLAPTNNLVPCTSYGSFNASSRRSASCSACACAFAVECGDVMPSTSTSGQHTTNSSPPSRTQRSPPRNALRSRFATWMSNSSPAACPSMSLRA